MRRILKTLRLLPWAIFRPHFTSPVIAMIRTRLKAGDYAAVDMQMSSLSAECMGSLIWTFAAERQAAALAARWSKAAPSSRHARILAAYADLLEAWKVRGEAYAQDIPWRRRRRYPKIMLRGQQKLLDIVKEDPSNVMALAGLVHCSVVIGVGAENRRTWFNQAMDVAPFHLPTLRQYARGTLERWGGEEDERYHFATWVTENAPVESCAHVVVAETVVDDALMATEQTSDIRLIARCIASEERAQWVREAILKWLAATPATLDRRLAETFAVHDAGFHRICLERFALAAYFSGAKDEACMLFTALQGQLQDQQWNYFIPPMPLLRRWIGSNQRMMRTVHDLVCRDLGLDLRKVCHP